MLSWRPGHVPPRSPAAPSTPPTRLPRCGHNRITHATGEARSLHGNSLKLPDKSQKQDSWGGGQRRGGGLGAKMGIRLKGLGRCQLPLHGCPVWGRRRGHVPRACAPARCHRQCRNEPMCQHPWPWRAALWPRQSGASLSLGGCPRMGSRRMLIENNRRPPRHPWPSDVRAAQQEPREIVSGSRVCSWGVAQWDPASQLSAFWCLSRQGLGAGMCPGDLGSGLSPCCHPGYKGKGGSSFCSSRVPGYGVPARTPSTTR